MKKKSNPDLRNKSDNKELIQLKESEELILNTFEQTAVGIAHVAHVGDFVKINQKGKNGKLF